MTAKTLYHFDPVTGEYVCKGEAAPDPLEPGKFLLPAHATFDAPPKTAAAQVAVRSGAGWSVESDRRGREYWLPDGSRHTVGEIGADVPAGALSAAPTLPATDADIDAETVRRIGLVWGADSQIDALAAQVNAINRRMEIGSSSKAADVAEKNALLEKQNKTAELRDKGKALRAKTGAEREALDIAPDVHWR